MLTGDELMASVLSSRATHMPTHTQLVEANNKSAFAPSALPKSAYPPMADSLVEI